jgi:hypothetical protein
VICSQVGTVGVYVGVGVAVGVGVSVGGGPGVGVIRMHTVTEGSSSSIHHGGRFPGGNSEGSCAYSVQSETLHVGIAVAVRVGVTVGVFVMVGVAVGVGVSPVGVGVSG